MEIYELMSAHYDMAHIGRMSIAFGMRAMRQALERREELKAWDMWLVNLPNMNKETFVPFKDYYAKLTTPISKRPAADIMAEAEEIHARIARQKGGADLGDI